MDNTQTNIENVTRLWSRAAQAFEHYYAADGFSYGYIPESQWPNKIWLHGTPSGAHLQEITALMAQGLPEMTLVHFDTGAPDVLESLQRGGFKETFFLHGMSLQRPLELPTQSGEGHDTLEFKRVTRPKDRKEWGRAFEAAFGYSISEETIARTQEEIQYFLIRAHRRTIGTLALFWTVTTVGIYSMGVVPEARGRGYAMEAMRMALCQSFYSGADLVVLQASAMGLPMYEKLGFTTEFLMRNYTLKLKSDATT